MNSLIWYEVRSRYLEVVNRGKIVNARNATVHQTKKKVLVILSSISQILTNQHEIRLERSAKRSLCVTGVASYFILIYF